MSATFAAIETATAANAVAALANVTATVGAVSVDAIFDNGHAAGLDIAGSAPSLLLPSSSAASATRGTSVVVGGVSYTVTSVEADGTGMTLLRLQEA